MRLTAKERVLLHLLECGRTAEEAEVSPDLAQEGVARGAGIEVRHFAQFVRPLIEEDLVRERRAHVAGIRQRRKIYALTAAGRASAVRLREKVKAQVIRIRDGDAVREGSLDQALQEIGTGASVLEVVRQVQDAGVLDLQAAKRPPETGFVEQISDAPRTSVFVGRQEELAEITREDGGPRVFVIRGIAGIGKTALASKACDLFRGRRSLFWHRIRSWESGPTVLAHLGRFLEALDRPGLSSVLKRGDVDLAAEVLRQDLPDTRALLVLDDAHEASRETLDVLRMLTEATVSAPDVKVLVLTRRVLSFYDARDTVIRGIVREIELAGLKSVDAAALLASGGDSAKLVGLGRRLAGHPLLIELVRSQRSDIPAAIRDVQRFVEETIYGELSEAERRMMMAASLYRVPVPRTTLFSIPGSSLEALVALRQRSLLRFVGAERYEVHDTIQSFFEGILSQEERRAFGKLALAQLHELAEAASSSGDWLANAACLSNALRIAQDLGERRALCESLGDANGRIGDVLGVSASYREALKMAPGPEVSARLHRKLASVLVDHGSMASAQKEIEAGLTALRGIDSVESGWLDLAQARLAVENYEPEVAARHAERALVIFRRFRERSGEAHSLYEAAEAAVWTGGVSSEGAPLARRYFQEALTLAEAMGDPTFEAKIRIAMATAILYDPGDYDAGMELLRAVEGSPAAMGDLSLRALFHLRRAWFAARFKRDFSTAERDLAEAERLARKIHNSTILAGVKWERADALVQLGRYGEAARLVEEVGSDLRRSDVLGFAADAYFCAAVYHLAEGDWDGFQRAASALHSPEFAGRLAYPFDRPALLAPLEALLRGDEERSEDDFMRIIRKVTAVPAHSQVHSVILWHDFFYYSVGLRALGRLAEADSYRRRALVLTRSYRNLYWAHVIESDFGDKIAATIRARKKAG